MFGLLVGGPAAIGPLRAYDTQTMWSRLLTFFVWLAVGASVVAWALPMMRSAPGTPQPVSGRVAPDAPVPVADWSALFGRGAAASAALPVAAQANRFRLVGVAGPVRPSGPGVALVSIDGKPPRALRAGDVLEGGLLVMEVTAHTVKLGPPGGPATLTLQVPLLPPPATGVPAGAALPPS